MGVGFGGERGSDLSSSRRGAAFISGADLGMLTDSAAGGLGALRSIDGGGIKVSATSVWKKAAFRPSAPCK